MINFTDDELHHVEQGLYRQRGNFICDVPEIDSALVKVAEARDQSMKPPTDAAKVDRATALLCEARELLKQTGNKRTVERVRLAISSAKGARRIVDYRATRAAEAAR